MKIFNAPCLQKSPAGPTDSAKETIAFSSSTSLHGVARATSAQSRAQRAFWMMVVVAGVAMAGWQVALRLAAYYAWPTSTSLTLHYVRDLSFPAVTFCNYNRTPKTRPVRDRYRRSSLHGTTDLLAALSILSAGIVDEWPEEVGDEVRRFWDENLNFSTRTFTRKHGFQLNSASLLECNFNSRPCGPQDFQHVFTEYGNCYTFNGGFSEEQRSLKQKTAGAGKGLQVLFDVQQWDYWENPELGFTGVGIRLVVHDPDEPPQVEALGLSIGVGTQAYVSVQHTKNFYLRMLKVHHGPAPTTALPSFSPLVLLDSFTRFPLRQLEASCQSSLPRLHPSLVSTTILLPLMAFCLPSLVQSINQQYPWGDCDPSKKLQSPAPYSMARCLQECEADLVERICGCKPFNFPGACTSRSTTTTTHDCVRFFFYSATCAQMDLTDGAADAAGDDGADGDPYDDADDDDADDDDADWSVAEHFRAVVLSQAQGMCTGGSHLSQCPVPCLHKNFPSSVSYATFPSLQAAQRYERSLNYSLVYMRENLLSIDVAYTDLNYALIQQQKTLPESVLLSDIGGQLGLFVGASVITIIEVLEFVARSAARALNAAASFLSNRAATCTKAALSPPVQG
uniref:Acid-sensing ion channel 5 n=1 Tax=Petromyzon marinus TaxID=7757 RepID=A0AAJ7WW92_PETMA|nr:acid-sensing ion channel 5 [Petromyzon marinus]